MSDPIEKIPVKVVRTEPTKQEEASNSLYEAHRKLYPKAVSGLFANWRIALVLFTQFIFYVFPWFTWNDRQAVLFDLVNRKFYIFGLVFWPQDFIYLAALLMISAFSLFFFTTIAGRLWCGYACPQTVYTEIFLWIEKWIEGDRNARIRLDQAGMSGKKFRVKTIKHTLWIVFSLWTGFTFVGFFTPIHTLWQEAMTFSFGPWETFWVFFYGFATYGNAGFMREQVCKYMCPYARFQSVMFDADTLIISYDEERGEPRGARKKTVDPKQAGLGSCVDCGVCVQVCPTGIDIRKGLQYECIGCAACIDACDEIMDKMNYPKGLIRYTTENALKHQYEESEFLSRLKRPRVSMYGLVLLGITIATIAMLAVRTPLKVSVVRDRASLVRETSDGLLENAYTLQFINTDEKAHRYVVEVAGLPDARLVMEDQKEIVVPSASNRLVAVRVQVNPEHTQKGNKTVVFKIRSLDNPEIKIEEKSSFISR